MNPVRLALSLIVTVAVIGFFGFKMASVFDSTSEALDAATGSSQTGGDDGGSLIRAANYGAALDTLRAKIGAGGEILELRLEPGKAAFQVRDGDEAQGYELAAGSDDLDEFGVDLIGPGKIEENVFPLARLTPGVPEKMVAGMHARDPRISIANVQFMTLDLDSITGEPEWSVNAGGSLYQADIDGSNLRKPGDRPAGTPTANPAQDAVKDAQSIADCVAAAGADTIKLQACTK